MIALRGHDHRSLERYFGERSIQTLEEAVNQDAASTAQPPWPWPDSLDALIAAPNHHTLLFENERVRVLDVRIPPGQTVPVHTHRWPCVLYTLSASEFIRCDAEGNVLADTRKQDPASKLPGTLWSTPMPPHSVENVGKTEIRVLSVELKDSGS
jgi:hypothetical protein